MRKRRHLNGERAVRRGIALGLALTALWVLSMTVDVDTVQAIAAGKDGRGTPEAGLPLRVYAGMPYFRRQIAGLPHILISASPLLSYAELQLLAEEKSVPYDGVESGEEELPDNDDQTQPDLEPHADENIVELTAKGKSGSRYIHGESVCLYNRTDKALDASVLTGGRIRLEHKEGPQILIVHTHGSEAYSQADGNTYEESDPYRTTDCARNIVRVGEAMATVFRGHGFRVLHDTHLYDYPAYNGSYDRSNAAVRSWLEQYPSIQLVLDVHRDALVGKEGQVYKLVTEEAGEKMAQVMFVVGSDDAGGAHPGWQDNLALAVRLQQGLERGYHHLARPIVLRSKTYNQELLPGSLLVEVGGHGNTLTEAIRGARLWADNTARTLQELLDAQTK